MGEYQAAEIDSYVAAGWWGDDTLTAKLAANIAARPTATALVDAPNRHQWCAGESHRVTWAELGDLVQGTADQLSEHGVGVGSRVGIQLPNVTELVVSLLAVLEVGAIAVPFPIQHRRHEVETGWVTAGLDTFVSVARPDRPDQIEMLVSVAAERTGSVLVFGEADNGTERIEIRAVPWRADGGAGSANDVATVCWTSGTTGTPKGVPRTHNAWVAAGLFNVAGIGLEADDAVLCPFPLVNMAGIGGMLVPWLVSGFRLVLHQPFDMPTFLGQIAQERVTYTVAPPALLSQLLRSHETLARFDLSSMRAIGSGAAPLDPGMVAGWQGEYGIEVINIFGSNEGAAMLATRALVEDPDLRARMFPAIGRPDCEWDTPVATVNRTRLVDLDTGADIEEPGRLGELRFRGSTVFGGYLDSDGHEFDDQGFYRTGDLFELIADDQGRLYYRFVDRAKDIIIRGGMNISASEIEALLLGHQGVRDVAVVPAPGGDLGEIVAAVIVVEEGHALELEDVIVHLRSENIASYKLPERLAVVEELPRNPLGKVLKSQLRDLFLT